MIQPHQDTEDLDALDLSQILTREDLELEEVLSVKGIHDKIRQSVGLFLDFCKRQDSFVDRLITLGLKCPMHQSTSPQMKAFTYIAADVLTSDHDAVADLLLPSADDQGEIKEEIEGEESPSESDRYKWINRVVQYLQGEQLDENCVNYIVKSLQVLVRKRLGGLLEYLRVCPDVLARFAQLAHFPSVAQLLTKLIVAEDDHNMPPAAHEARQMVIPLLLQKLHTDLALPSALEVVDSLEQILMASRYADPEETRSELQRLSDIIVSAQELSYHLAVLLPPSASALNAVSYLAMVVARMNLDETHEEMGQLPFRPTLLYQVEPIFAAFARLAATIGQLAGADKLLAVRWLQLLVSMARHSRFGTFYAGIGRDERLQGVRTLVWGVARGVFAGVALQLVCTLVELVVLQEERITLSNCDAAIKLSPNTLYSVLSDHQLHLQQLIHDLSKEQPRQRNRNQQGVFLRKLLLVLDNFFKNSEIHRHFPEVEAVATLFPSFTSDACRQYAQGASVTSHPAGNRARAPLEFGFMRRNQEFLAMEEPDLLDSLPDQLPPQEEPKKPKETEIVFKLTQKIRTMKDRVREKHSQKQMEENKGKIEEESVKVQEGLKENKREQNQKVEVNDGKKEGAPQQCLHFFARHLTIY